MSTTIDTASPEIAGLTEAQAVYAAAQGAAYLAKIRKLATTKRAARVQADMDAHAVPVEEAPPADPLPSDNAPAIDALAADTAAPDTWEAVTLDLPETAESYLARLMGEATAQPAEPVIVARRRAGLAALDGTAKGRPGVNDHNMVRPEMKAAWPFARSVYAGGWAPGEVIVQHMSSGHQSRIFMASPVDARTGNHVIADPEAQGASKSVQCAWLYPAGQAGLLVNVGRGRWEVQADLFDVLSTRDLAALADERAANRSAYGMGPDPMLEGDDA